MLASLVPLVLGVAIIHQPCPGYSQPYSCYQPQTRTIYLRPHAGRLELFHEYGHAYDYDGHVNHPAMKQLLGFPKTWGWRKERRYSESPAELFAEAYAQCAIGIHNRVCKTLRTSGQRASAKAASQMQPPSP